MRLLWLCFLAVAVVVASGEDEFPRADPCDADVCGIPNCQCSSTNNPEGLSPKDTPQVCSFIS